MVGALVGACTLVGVGTAAAKPMHVNINERFAQPPTTEQCIAAFGIPCYQPHQYYTAYDMKSLFASGINGSGKTIVIVDSFGSPTIQNDIKTFDDTYKLPPAHVTVIQPAGPVPAWGSDPAQPNWGFETSLDVEYAHAMAPGANILLVETPVAETEGVQGLPQMMQSEKYVIDHHMGDVITQSFGATEETFPSSGSIQELRYAFEDAARNNVSVLASAGDGGVSNQESNGTTYYPFRVNSWPSSDPLVTSLGGTQLTLDHEGNRLAPDQVWNDSFNPLINGGTPSPIAGGGGDSAVFLKPRYQEGVENVVGVNRGTPDISMSAAVNGAALVYLSFPGMTAGWYLVGGTSEASPLFSGIVADADQAAGHDLGQLNPRLYALGAAHAPGIVDITNGNNTVPVQKGSSTVIVPGYNAVPGYDMASGLGTADGAQLVSELSGK